jgi:hypothetical protein
METTSGPLLFFDLRGEFFGVPALALPPRPRARSALPPSSLRSRICGPILPFSTLENFEFRAAGIGHAQLLSGQRSDPVRRGQLGNLDLEPLPLGSGRVQIVL